MNGRCREWIYSWLLNTLWHSEGHWFMKKVAIPGPLLCPCASTVWTHQYRMLLPGRPHVRVRQLLDANGSDLPSMAIFESCGSRGFSWSYLGINRLRRLYHWNGRGRHSLSQMKQRSSIWTISRSRQLIHPVTVSFPCPLCHAQRISGLYPVLFPKCLSMHTSEHALNSSKQSRCLDLPCCQVVLFLTRIAMRHCLFSARSESACTLRTALHLLSWDLVNWMTDVYCD